MTPDGGIGNRKTEKIKKTNPQNWQFADFGDFFVKNTKISLFRCEKKSYNMLWVNKSLMMVGCIFSFDFVGTKYKDLWRGKQKMEKQKQKVRRFSIRWKIIVPACIIVILMAVVMGANSYVKIRNGMVEMGGEEAAMAVKIVVSAVDGDALETVTADSVGSDAYNDIYNDISNARNQCGDKIIYLYTLYTDGSTVYYGIDTDTIDPCEYGEV